MELSSYISILVRRKWLVLICTLLGIAIAVVITLISTPQYKASTTVRVLTIGAGTVTTANPNIIYTERLVSTYSRIITGDTIRRQIQQELGLEKKPVLTIDTVPGTELIRINAEAPDPEDARDIVNTAAAILIQQNREFYSGGDGQSLQEILAQRLATADSELAEARANYSELLASSPEDAVSLSVAAQAVEVNESIYGSLLSQYEAARLEETVRANSISVVEEAELPEDPSSPRALLYIALGFAVGLAMGVIMAFVAENLDTTLHTTEQIESATQMATVGQVPSAKDELAIARLGSGHYPQLESFRRLRTNILASSPNGKQVVLLTSAKRGEGKSTVSGNLAVTVAQSGREVVVVDCDLRLPTVHKLFDLSNKRGLTNILAGEMTLEDSLQDSPFPRLRIITSGPLPPNPSELLGSQRMLDLIDQLREEFDFIILDTPALLSVADAAVLAPAVDNVILVVAQGVTQRGDVQAVRQQLSNVRVKSMEVVVNRAEANGSYAYYESDSR